MVEILQKICGLLRIYELLHLSLRIRSAENGLASFIFALIMLGIDIPDSYQFITLTNFSHNE